LRMGVCDNEVKEEMANDEANYGEGPPIRIFNATPSGNLARPSHPQLG